MKKQAGLQYVKDFSFPSECGFTGSAGKSEVKGYMRGGSVKSRNRPNTSKKLAKGTTRMQMGGGVNAQKMGYQGGDDKEIDVGTIGVTVRARGGRAKNSTHDKLMRHGKKMGFKQGGQVKVRRSIGNTPDDIGRKKYDPSPKDKNTSKRFDMKKGKMDSMDHGNQPARRGANARSQQDRESGGTGRLRPGLKKGGRVKKGPKKATVGALAAAAAKKTGRLVKEGHFDPGGAYRKKHGMTGQPHGKRPKAPAKRANPDHTKGKGMSKRGMPKNVKARGGTVGKHGAAR